MAKCSTTRLSHRGYVIQNNPNCWYENGNIISFEGAVSPWDLALKKLGTRLKDFMNQVNGRGMMELWNYRLEMGSARRLT